MVATVTTSASFTFSCPPDQVQIAVMTGQEVYGYHLLQTVGVTACGHRAVYVGIPRLNGYGSPTCSWLLNVQSADQPTP